MTPNNFEDIRMLLKEVRAELMNKPNVVATGIGYKITDGRTTPDLSIICSVEVKKAKSGLRKKDLIPSTIQNLPTDVKPTGVFHAWQDPKGRFRPAPGGVSIGHTQITAGTLGCLVKKNNELYILSNNHVLANSNDASTGDAILQPGPADGGVYPDDQIATLSDFVPIQFEQSGGDSGSGSEPDCGIASNIAIVLNGMAALVGSNTRLRPYRRQQSENFVDCAMAKPLTSDDVSLEILQAGNINSIQEGELGMNIKKSGRTTGFTTGIIEQVAVTTRVSYGVNKVALFTDQLLAGAMSQGGDSGSAVLDENNNLVGLLFAGSNTSTVINRISHVFNLLGVTLP